MRRLCADERGSVAAELALALPAVVITLLLGASVLGAAAQQVALQDAVADAARLLGRGESAASAQAVVAAAVPSAHMSGHTRGELICASAQVDARIGALIRIPLSASSCALSGGL
ncbi:TadE family type IV pilus minor pilin [uncultured Microbacterium sp.]|uniref:TadE family type IV pilus minor pilin n=1 Tax=uncultured Microbacterium sp. TaxID=191216 RepID=UPI0026162EA2|nr:TadE family type IV pilus minor pilin [uncultured Microbacterium sp.]